MYKRFYAQIQVEERLENMKFAMDISSSLFVFLEGCLLLQVWLEQRQLYVTLTPRLLR